MPGSPARGTLGDSLAVTGGVERRSSTRPQRVLIVDDAADIRELWRLWLTLWGFAVEEASNGYEAIGKALAFKPDLILMDLWMPVMGGVETMRHLKGDSRTAHVPVLALSAQSTAPDPAAVTAAGAAAFISKPCDPDILLDHIRAAMGRSRNA